MGELTVEIVVKYTEHDGLSVQVNRNFICNEQVCATCTPLEEYG